MAHTLDHVTDRNSNKLVSQFFSCLLASLVSLLPTHTMPTILSVHTLHTPSIPNTPLIVYRKPIRTLTIGCRIRIYSGTSPHSFMAQLGHLHCINDTQYIFKLQHCDRKDQLIAVYKDWARVSIIQRFLYL